MSRRARCAAHAGGRRTAHDGRMRDIIANRNVADRSRGNDMATKKDKPAAAAPVAAKVVVRKTAARVAAQPVATPVQAAGNSQRLLREAAWSRMFGRADTKNPFAR